MREEKDEDQGGTWTGTLTVSIRIYLFEKDVSKKWMTGSQDL